MTLRDEILELLLETDYPKREMVDKILAFLDAQRCEWTNDCDGMTHTECGAIRCYDYILEHVISYDPYCPCCGRRIEIGEG